MNMQKHSRLILDRRNFILATLMCPMICRSKADNHLHPGTLSLVEEEGFIILGGWVLVKDDLIGKLA